MAKRHEECSPLIEIIYITLKNRRGKFDLRGVISDEELLSGALKISEGLPSDCTEWGANKIIDVLKERVKSWEQNQVDFVVAKILRYA